MFKRLYKQYIIILTEKISSNHQWWNSKFWIFFKIFIFGRFFINFHILPSTHTFDACTLVIHSLITLRYIKNIIKNMLKYQKHYVSTQQLKSNENNEMHSWNYDFFEWFLLDFCLNVTKNMLKSGVINFRGRKNLLNSKIYFLSFNLIIKLLS